MRTVLLLLIATLAACAAEPTTSSTIAQLCQRDPVTGRCKTTSDPSDAQSVSEGWVLRNYSQAVLFEASCSEYRTSTGHHGWDCNVSFSLFGQDYVAGCFVDDTDGLSDCDVEER